MPLTFPVNLAAAGVSIFSQAYVTDPLVPANTLASSAGLRTEITMPPLIFCGITSYGTNSTYAFVNPLAASVQVYGPSNVAIDPTSSVFAHGGLDLFISKDGQYWPSHLSRADLRGATPVWSTFFLPSPPARCFGAFHDWKRDLIYTLKDDGTARELVAINSRLSSSTFGQQVATSIGIGLGSRWGQWCLSRTGNRAAVWNSIPPSVYSTAILKILDTEPSSPTYLQVLLSTPIPFNSSNTNPQPGIWNVGFTPNDETVVVLIGDALSRQIARYHIPSGVWLDSNPATPQVENIALPPAGGGLGPTDMDVSHNGRFAIVTRGDYAPGGNGPGYAYRVDFGPDFPYPATLTLIHSSSFVVTNGTISRDDSMLSIFDHLGMNRIFNATTGAVIAQIQTNLIVNTSCWR